ncbi:hypothetical protein VIGAN_11188000 [Vigna angularis var. angularis]|uniref:Uncharacterized protein n=1 Tax=Vigna angularis var. angularis TaxID=157739 RepID=A0A0S3TAX8_PHAAN|nr:hypothetical protein VIGAN_11188000 [Vigna angularis var. angularis]
MAQPLSTSMAATHQQPHFTSNDHLLLFPPEAMHWQATTKWRWLPTVGFWRTKRKAKGSRFWFRFWSLRGGEILVADEKRTGKGEKGREREQLFLEEEGNETLTIDLKKDEEDDSDFDDEVASNDEVS